MKLELESGNVIEEKHMKKNKSLLLYKIRKNPMTILGLSIIVIMALLAIFAPYISSYNPTEMNVLDRFQEPSLKHLFGTDEVGRDILTRVIYGTRISLTTGISVVVMAGVIGVFIGSVCGYFGGYVDQVVMRIMDMILAFPTLILAMVLAATLGASLFNVMLAIAIVKIPVYVRLSRGEALVVKNNLYVKAARTFGLSNLYVIFRHIIPNVITPIIIQLTLDLGDTILLVATLGFLGLGAKPPTPEWGTMISTGFKYMLEQWWYPTFPGIAVFLASTGFNLIGDGLRDILDPKSSR
ncbi:ABC transporter permease subunit [Clostridium tyrobutyricum]|jgi:peptide/nickel transport system permease protein|uniref:Dipeptide transport system permease protein DppC (TC 3.A.1.5.2) Putative hemine transporter ATP-binding subunit n=1 Tax=Clostridium tyrobutyricum DIVETGP TaxID=1408889 RepID=W6N7G5_CLOTY|nr:ABC transporter permease subunit [Clostridium tyrobutyricum]AND83770.1 oligopeptide ABC transporter permease [Clostridium tyrobutyricum]ANP68531.1 D-ala-D-ala transporter subunit [Clostridium tyrobutyricum]MBR9647352.1 ABC transporter permease subunit [Clostridium tyrobutyricum]MBV4416444.1 ABC transporter permease subunit [Clostridium tyrobutyricum]MBV4417876.1 ABC transporter permease subunit [Clostridium tyrobutyricum]